MLVVSCAPEEDIDYDSHTCITAKTVSYRVKQAVPTTAHSLYRRTDIGELRQQDTSGLIERTVDIVIIRYNCEDDID